MSLRPCSDEQQQAVRCIMNGNNLIVSATAGSGKTTAVFYIAKAFPDKIIILLTYNNRLSAETTHKMKALGITNLVVFTYHAAMCAFYDPRCQNDRAVRDLVLSCAAPPIREIAYDLMIYDEVQDMTPTYFEICCKLRRDNVPPSKQELCMAVFGDENQCIFQYNNADERYLTMANLLSVGNSRPWVKCAFSTSHRVTREIANVINYTMRKKEHMLAVKSGQRVRYVIGNTWEENYKKSEPYRLVAEYLEVAEPGQIFVLVPSINMPAAKKLENMLKRHPPNGRTSTPIYVPSNEDERVREDTVTSGKIVFSSFHQSKGLERDYVLVLSFDKSYFDFYNKSDDPNVCPNPLYVAATRAKVHLTLFHDYQCDYLPFLDVSTLEKYTDMGGSIPLKLSKKTSLPKKMERSVTEIIKRLGIEDEDIAMSCVDVRTITGPCLEDECVCPPTVTADKLEEISAITGTAIPLSIELCRTGRIKMLETLGDWDKSHPMRTNRQFSLASINVDNITTVDLLYIATCHHAKQNGYWFKLYQLADYEWLTDSHLDTCASRVDEVSDNSEFEVRVKAVVNDVMVCGDIDCFDRERNCVYEFKCTKDLDTTHVLQLAIYAYLYMCTYPNAPVPTFYLLNLLTNERREISSSFERLQTMMEHLVNCKCADRTAPLTDAEFLAANRVILDKYWPPPLADDERRVVPFRARSPPRYLEDYIVA